MPDSNQPEQHTEHRVHYRDPASGADVTVEETLDPRRAGEKFRAYRDLYKGQESGELSLEKRVVTKSPWETIESIDLANKPA